MSRKPQPARNAETEGPAAPSSAAEHTLGPGPRTQLQRRSARGRYDKSAIHAVIDETLHCHVAFVVDGEARVLPTAHARDGDAVYLHGARTNAMLGALLQNGQCSLAFTLIDGIVFARTALHHSMNYRCVIAFGETSEVTDDDGKRRALSCLLDHVAKGRSREVAPPSDEDLRATLVVRVTLTEASMKSRALGAADPEWAMGDEALYAGVLPLSMRASAPIRDAALVPGTRLPTAVAVRARALGANALREVPFGAYLLSDDPSRLDFEYVHQFLAHDSYWARGIEAGRLETAMSRSLCFGVYREGTQVGFGRAVTDTARFAYLADIFVDEEHRGTGLGKALVGFMLAHPSLEGVSRVTLGTRDAQSLYAAFGFEPREGITMMVRER